MEAEDEENLVVQCAVCGTTEGDAANLSSQTTLQTNATVRCGHMFCSNCIQRESARGRGGEFLCPVCQAPVKKTTLTTRSLDHVQCEKDTTWRRRIMSVYNLTEKDFPSLLEYNNFLEEVEDKIFAIINEEPEAEEIKKQIKEYELQNRAQIVIRQSRRADEERSIEDRIADEQRLTDESRKAAMEDKRLEVADKKRFKKEQAEVLLGEREEVSAEARQAQMQGYRSELRRQQQGKKAVANFVSPKVREPVDGLKKEESIDGQTREKRQHAGGGLVSGNLLSDERAWNETSSSLFASI